MKILAIQSWEYAWLLFLIMMFAMVIWLADKKDRSIGIWLLASVLFTPFVTFIALILIKKNQSQK